ncbi:hypothetical protein [Pedobacter sp.]|uniref:hypothetical protein n=1 Tax=Pedobacter sp. TaxID=1411316 RepID=UPI003C6505AE
MKNQISNAVNTQAEFLDIKSAKNPIYQPLAGKTLPAKDDKSAKDAPGNQSAAKVEGNKVACPVEKPAMDLEGTLKLVEELHRRMVQRGRLVHTINNLEKFELEQKEEAEDTTSNYYQGCELEISDDKRNKFSTKNPVIIKSVALFVRDLCTSRLAEIEAEIIIPA